MAEPTAEEMAIQEAECPLIRGAYRTGDPAVIRKAKEIHPPSRCSSVRKAATAK